MHGHQRIGDGAMSRSLGVNDAGRARRRSVVTVGMVQLVSVAPVPLWLMRVLFSSKARTTRATVLLTYVGQPAGELFNCNTPPSCISARGLSSVVVIERHEARVFLLFGILDRAECPTVLFLVAQPVLMRRGITCVGIGHVELHAGECALPLPLRGVVPR